LLLLAALGSGASLGLFKCRRLPLRRELRRPLRVPGDAPHAQLQQHGAQEVVAQPLLPTPPTIRPVPLAPPLL
jgi:hypothetical protein